MLKFKRETEFKKTEIGEIPRDWEIYELDRVVKKFKNGGTPSTKVNEYWKGDIPWITSDHLEGLYVREGDKYISEKAIVEKKTSIAKPGTLLVATRVGIGKLSIAKKRIAFNQDVTAVWLKDIVDVEYIVRLLRSRVYQEYLERISDGTTVGGISRNTLKLLPVLFPPPSEQSRIATVLSWFDNLIENKKRQNEILEKAAMAIFKSWFVDFEPFQDEEFVYSEELDREVPKGWEVKKLGDFAEIIMGQSPPSKYYNYKRKGLPFVQGKGQYGKYTPETTVYCSRLVKIAKPYDILVTVRAPVGELNLSDCEYVIGRGVASLRSKYWAFLFLYLLTDNERLKSYERGTTYDAITKEEVDSFSLLLPPFSILQRFHSLVEPLFQKIILNQKQIMVLRKIRDALLPQLIFGKLRVAEL